MAQLSRGETLGVDDPGVRFERRRREWNVEGLRTAALTSFPVVLLSWLFEEFAGIPRPYERGAIRAIGLGLLLFGLFLSERRRERAIATIDWLMPLTYAWLSFLAIRLMHLHDGYESPYFLVMTFCVVGVPAVTLWPARLFVAYEGVLYALYLGPLVLGFASIRSMDTFLIRLWFLIGLTGIGATTQWMHNRMVRHEVDAQVRLGGALGRIAGMKAERLAWLERLAGFLRHELKNHIVAVRSSLDLMEQAPPGTPPERYVGRARRGLGRMNRLVSSATEATSLEAALAVEARESVDLSAVTRDRLDLFRRTTVEIPVRSEIEGQIVVDGNEDRLAQMVDKLLENAVEHVADTGEVRVTLAREGSEAVLTIEDEGDPLPEHKEALFNAFVSIGKRNPGATNVGLGLFVTRVIAESHAGRVAAEDLPAKRGARFVVTLPLAEVGQR